MPPLNQSEFAENKICRRGCVKKMCDDRVCFVVAPKGEPKYKLPPNSKNTDALEC